jgi:prevent-host-death family protein
MTSGAVEYNQDMRNRVVTATELKAKCLALLDEVDDRGDMITVTKRGRPIATLQPVKKKPWKSPRGAWIGKVKIVGDIVNLDTSHLWDVARKG